MPAHAYPVHVRVEQRAAYFASSRASLSSEVAPVSRLAAVAGSKLYRLRIIGNGFRILKDCG